LPSPRKPTPPRKRVTNAERLDYLVQAASTQHHQLERIMASVAELQAALDRNTAATTAYGVATAASLSAQSDEIVQLQAAIAALTPGEPVTQEQIDQLNASSTAIETGNAALTAGTAALTADDPATP
jgi:chromosome segregation ATPase